MRQFLFACLFFSCYGTRAQSTGDLVISGALAKLEHAKTYTLQVAELMPASGYGFKPEKDEMTFGEQLLHLSQNLGWLSASYLAKENNPVTNSDMRIGDKDSIKHVVAKAYDYALDALKKFDPMHLKDTVQFFAGQMNMVQILTLINDHQTHHRGQLLVYLRLKGITPPKYVGW